MEKVSIVETGKGMCTIMDINVFLFENFETLDVFGPVEIFGHLQNSQIHFVSVNGGIIRSRQGTEIVTQTVDNMNANGILVIPGGQGTRTFVDDAKFVDKLSELVTAAQYCLAVCTGSALLAKTGQLDGCRATSNKRAFDWVVSVNPEVKWIASARWVVDGKFYTSSGVSAGMDMSLGFVADILGIDIAEEIADAIEYVWNSDKDNDRFTI